MSTSPQDLHDIDVDLLNSLLVDEDFDIFNNLNIQEDDQKECVPLNDIQIDPSFSAAYAPAMVSSLPFDSYLNKDFLTETVKLHPDHPNESPFTGRESSISTTPESRASFYYCSSRDSFSSRGTINSQSKRYPSNLYTGSCAAAPPLSSGESHTPPSSGSAMRRDDLFLSFLTSCNDLNNYRLKSENCPNTFSFQSEDDKCTLQSPRSYRLQSFGSGQCSSGNSPERKHLLKKENRTQQQKSQEDSPTAAYGFGRHVSRSSSRVYSSASSDVTERARSPVLPVQRHKRHSHIRAEKKRKARIQEEFNNLKSSVRRAQGKQDLEESSESLPKALQLKQGADCLRKLQLENKLAEVEYNSLLQEKNMQKHILERSWQRMDQSNKRTYMSGATSEQGGTLAQKIYHYHESRQATFGFNFKIFQEIVEPLSATLFLHLQSEKDLPTQAVHFHEQMLQQLRQSLLNTHSSLQNLFWKPTHQADS